jgi:hypothetical protein
MCRFREVTAVRYGLLFTDVSKLLLEQVKRQTAASEHNPFGAPTLSYDSMYFARSPSSYWFLARILASTFCRSCSTPNDPPFWLGG